MFDLRCEERANLVIFKPWAYAKHAHADGSGEQRGEDPQLHRPIGGQLRPSIIWEQAD
jgi:hypothetical protein